MPAVEQSRLEWIANDEDEARDEARRVGETIEVALTDSAGVEVKPDAPSQVLCDVIAEYAPDEVIVAAREGEILRQRPISQTLGSCSRRSGLRRRRAGDGHAAPLASPRIRHRL